MVRILLLTGILLFTGPLRVSPVDKQSGEYEVKAAFLEKFARYTRWPDESASDSKNKPFVITVLGQNPFGPLLESVYKNHPIKNRTVSIRYIDNLDELRHTHILFISDSERAGLSTILTAVKQKPILTVADTKGFGEKGVCINFFITSSRTVHFEMNRRAIEQTPLVVNSMLYDVAKMIP